MPVDNTGMDEIELSPLNYPLERPVSRGSQYKPASDQKELALRFNGYGPCPLHLVEVQAMFPPSFH